MVSICQVYIMVIYVYTLVFIVVMWTLAFGVAEYV